LEFPWNYTIATTTTGIFLNIYVPFFLLQRQAAALYFRMRMPLEQRSSEAESSLSLSVNTQKCFVPRKTSAKCFNLKDENENSFMLLVSQNSFNEFVF